MRTDSSIGELGSFTIPFKTFYCVRVLIAPSAAATLFFMALLRGLFWFALFIVFTFCFVVLFEYGPGGFAKGVRKEYARVKSFAVKQTQEIAKTKKNR
jgi:hypothetical protein